VDGLTKWTFFDPQAACQFKLSRAGSQRLQAGMSNKKARTACAARASCKD
jgi:hypothetical protein